MDAAGHAYATGQTGSTDFPITPDAFDTTLGYYDAYVTELNASGSRMLYSTFLGGSASEGSVGIVFQEPNRIYLTGTTDSSDFPTSPGAFDSTNSGNDAFVTKLILPPPYEVPRSASQLSVALLPAFRPCGTSGNPVNASHAPPLSVGSCTPPRPGGVARIGSQSTMSSTLTAVPGDHLDSNGDQADAALTVGMSDVTTAAGSDYLPSPSGPDMTLYARFRFTDLSNGGSGSDPGTATDFDFAVPVDCAATPSGSVGSTCSANTSADAVTPGLIKEERARCSRPSVCE